MSRPYYALNGNEVVEIIRSEVERALEASGKFGIAKTFPQVSWKWTLEMDVYPSEPRQFEIKVEGKKKASDPVPGLEPLHMMIEGGREDIGKKISPDQVRKEEGIPLLHPVQKKGGIVDELMDSLK